MATTTPNYLWSVPTSSDLVKNGATAIETLGDSVDASLWSSGYGQAGKNKLINGDFSVNQRSFSTTTTTDQFNFDRWRTRYSGGTSTTTAQVFTLGAAPVAGYESKNFYRVAITGQAAVTDSVRVEQQIESVRTFAGQTATLSFWAKASAGTPKIAITAAQAFASGSGGSATVSTDYGTVTLSTSWVRYSVVCAIPSISGKTIGTSPDDLLVFRLYLSAGTSVTGNQGIGYQNVTFDLWGIQAEAGSYATPFQLAGGGDPQSELAMCQRYYVRFTSSTQYNFFNQGGFYNSTTNYVGAYSLPVQMRVTPTSVDFSTLRVVNSDNNAYTVSAIALGDGGLLTGYLNVTTAVATSAKYALLGANNSTSAYLGFSAEL